MSEQQYSLLNEIKKAEADAAWAQHVENNDEYTRCLERILYLESALADTH